MLPWMIRSLTIHDASLDKKAMQLEIKLTLESTKSKDYCNTNSGLPKDPRQAVELTISYHMNWNKRSSSHRYDSLSSHAFAIGVYTRRIIDCVVFSKCCSFCSARNKDIEIINSNHNPNKNLTNNSTSTAYSSDATGLNRSGGVNIVPTVVNGRNDTSKSTTVVNAISEDLTPVAIVVNGSSNIMPSTTVVDGSGKVALGINRGVEEGFLDVQGADYDCVFDYLESSGGMEFDRLSMLFKKFHKEISGQVHCETFITDDDTRLRQYLSHSWYKGKGTKNRGGSLLTHIPEPHWLTELTNRAKCVEGIFLKW